MTVPSPRNRGSRHALRVRGKGFFFKQNFSCFHLILFLISAQILTMFLMAMTVGQQLLGMEAWQEIDGVAPASSYDDDKTVQERKRRLAAFEVGDERQHRVLYSGAADGTEEHALGLDNYGSRKHLVKRDEYTSSAPYLIVGGSDGSGTRAVVNQVIELGALFHVEDRRTMDVHGSEMFHKGGWPPLVNLIMNVTHSANYELSDLPKDVREKAVTEMAKLKKSIDKRSENKIKKQIGREGTANVATAIRVGWKAPVSMLLLPVIKEVFGQVKFLHVVRDGRDVCLSDNQSPVKKFYNTYYGHPETPLPEESSTTQYAMELWNDMNQQVMEWGRSHSNGVTFDYLTIRTEDIVNPETKLDALLQLSDFVGSKKSVAELCCLSQQEVKDMGKSVKGFGDPLSRRRGGPGGGNYMGLGMSKEDFMADILGGPPGFHDHMIDHEFIHSHRVTPDKTSVYQKIRQQKEARDDDKPLQFLVDKKRQRDEIMRQRREEIEERTAHRKREYHNPVAQGIHSLMKHHKNVEEHKLENEGGVRRRLLTGRERQEHQALLERRRKRFPFRPGALGHSPFGRGMNKLQREAPEQVKARYGKWVKALEDKPELSAELHQLGKTGLEAFGYEPATMFLHPPDDSFAQQCQVILEQNVCTGPPAPVEADPRIGTSCSFSKPKEPGVASRERAGKLVSPSHL